MYEVWLYHILPEYMWNGVDQSGAKTVTIARIAGTHIRTVNGKWVMICWRSTFTLPLPWGRIWAEIYGGDDCRSYNTHVFVCVWETCPPLGRLQKDNCAHREMKKKKSNKNRSTDARMEMKIYVSHILCSQRNKSTYKIVCITFMWRRTCPKWRMRLKVPS